MKRIVLDNSFLPPRMRLFEDSQLRTEKDIDSVQNQFSLILDASTENPFKVAKIKRLVNRACEIFDVQSISIEEVRHDK